LSSNSHTPTVLNALELIVAEMRQLRTAGPHFRIIHRFHIPGTECLSGEEIFAVFLCWRGREFQLRLSPALLLVFDYLANHSRITQSAKQIELGIRADDFYRQHAKNANGKPALIRRVPRSAVREHIKRLRRALSRVFNEANLAIDPRKVVIVESTVSNLATYKIRATFQWTHIDLTSRTHQPLL
jgi:hypothetical protein